MPGRRNFRIYLVPVCACVSGHGLCVEDTGQLMGVSSLLPPFMWSLEIELRWSGSVATAFSAEPFMGPGGDILEGKVGIRGGHWHTLLQS